MTLLGMRWSSGFVGAALLAFASSVHATSAYAAIDATPAGVQFQARGDGAVIATSAGMTLYTFGRDQTPGKSACNATCAKQWPAFLAPADVAPAGEWSIITRDDGGHQWAFRGEPLYTYARDVAAGDSYGDDLNGQWHIAFRPIFTPPEISVHKTLQGVVLANAAGLTLYVSDRDKPTASACDEKCVHTWLPVGAPWSARAVGDWSVVTRDDGIHQWAYKGKLLYSYVNDTHVGVITGDGVDKSWHAMVLQTPPPLPAWVRVHESDAGELLTDTRGQTLYQRIAVRRQAGGVEDMGSDDAPATYHAVTVAATEDAKPVGNWSIVDARGTKQWAYKGFPLYTNELDIQAGDLKGIRGSDRSFHTIMRSGEPMQGTGQ